MKSKKDAGITMQSKHEAVSSEVFIPCKTMMNYMQEAKEESGRSGLGSGYTSKAPVTVNTLHDQKNLMLFQLSQFSVSPPKSRLRKRTSSSSSSRYGFNSEEMISPNNRCRRSHLEGEESEAYPLPTMLNEYHI